MSTECHYEALLQEKYLKFKRLSWDAPLFQNSTCYDELAVFTKDKFCRSFRNIPKVPQNLHRSFAIDFLHTTPCCQMSFNEILFHIITFLALNHKKYAMIQTIRECFRNFRIVSKSFVQFVLRENGNMSFLAALHRDHASVSSSSTHKQSFATGVCLVLAGGHIFRNYSSFKNIERLK